MDYYETLGLPKKASIEDVKKSYKKLALIYHPDKPTGDRDKFEVIHKAYLVLSDPEQKALYDTMFDIPEDDTAFNSFMSTLFDNLLATINKIKKTKKQDVNSNKSSKETNTHPKKRVSTITNKIDVTLDEVYRGDVKKLVIRVRRDDVWKKEIFFINLLEHKKVYTFEDQGDHVYGYKGDIEVLVNVIEHERVKIDNILCEFDLYIEETMTLYEYYTGIRRDIMFLDAEVLTLDIIDINKSNKHTNYVHVVEGKGLPYIKDEDVYYGNLYVYFTLELPSTIDDTEVIKVFNKSKRDGGTD